MHQWHKRIYCAVWKLLVVVSISISVTSSSIGLVYGNSTLIEDSQSPAPSRVLACGSRLKLEIKSICTSNRETSNHGQAYYSPVVPEILQPRRKERNDRLPNRRPAGNLLLKIVNRVPRGVIEECCRKPCDRQSLLKYCASFDRNQPTAASPTSTELSAETIEQVESNSSRVRNQSVILPLLIQLLWNWESWEKPYSTNILTYYPQNLFKIVKSQSNRNCSRGRGISARDIDGNVQILSNTNIFSKSSHSMSSDETRRDSQVSEEIMDELVIPYYNASPLETLAVTVTDEPLSQVFPIAAGTNANDYT